MTIKQFLIIVCTLLTFISCNDTSIFNEDRQPVTLSQQDFKPTNKALKVKEKKASAAANSANPSWAGCYDDINFEISYFGASQCKDPIADYISSFLENRGYSLSQGLKYYHTSSDPVNHRSNFEELTNYISWGYAGNGNTCSVRDVNLSSFSSTTYCPGDNSGGGGGPVGPGGGSGTGDIVNQIINPCLNNMVNSVIEKDISFTTQKTLRSVFGENKHINLFFKDSENLAYNNLGNAIPKNMTYDNGVLTGLDVDITLNSNVLPETTQEYVATIIVHEAIHAYLNFQGFIYNTDQHQMMLSSYIGIISYYLITNYQMSGADAYALAFEGMEDVFENDLDNATKLSIINKLGNKLPSKNDRMRIRAEYEMGYKGTKCE